VYRRSGSAKGGHFLISQATSIGCKEWLSNEMFHCFVSCVSQQLVILIHRRQRIYLWKRWTMCTWRSSFRVGIGNFFNVVQRRGIAVSPPSLHREVLRNEFSRIVVFIVFIVFFFCYFFVLPLLFEPTVKRNILPGISCIPDCDCNLDRIRHTKILFGNKIVLISLQENWGP
jgi:hypothetical protein